MNNILFIIYEFPPLSRGGVYRSTGFIKYLQEFDINPIVMTLDQQDFPKVYGDVKLDDTIGEGYLHNIEKIKVSSLKVLNQDAPKIRQFTNVFFSVNGREARGWAKHLFGMDFSHGRIGWRDLAGSLVTPPAR